MFPLLHSFTNKEQYENASAINQLAIIKIWLCSLITSQHNHREAVSCYHELTPPIVSQKNWDTKEDKGKSMKFYLKGLLAVLRLG